MKRLFNLFPKRHDICWRNHPLHILQGITPIQRREIKTNTAVLNEATIVIGGFTNKSKRKSISKIPLLGDLPLLGWLFRNKRIDRTNDELLIFLTPRIQKA